MINKSKNEIKVILDDYRKAVTSTGQRYKSFVSRTTKNAVFELEQVMVNNLDALFNDFADFIQKQKELVNDMHFSKLKSEAKKLGKTERDLKYYKAGCLFTIQIIMSELENIKKKNL